MVDPGSYPTHLSPLRGDPRLREEAQHDIHQAVLVLRAQHDVREATAYTMLVQASVDRRMSVRETARRIVADAV